MSKELIQQEIGDLLEVIKEQQEMVLAYAENVPQIELDILMANIRKLYERYLDLNKWNGKVQQTPELPEPVPAPQKQPMPENNSTDQLLAAISNEPVKENFTEVSLHSVEVLEEKLSEEVSNELPESITVPEQMLPEELVTNVTIPDVTMAKEMVQEEHLPQVTLAQERTKEFTKPNSKTQGMASLFDDAPTISQKFQPAKSLHDKISSEREDKSLIEKMKKNPVADLKKSIGINEKFAFINELFDGDLNNYNDAIDMLNNSSGHTHAIEMLQSNLSSKYNWNGDSDAFLKLKNLLDRRFSA